jgi:hypothetical protein
MYSLRRTTLALLLCWASGALAQPLAIGIRGHLVQQGVFSLFVGPGEELRLDLESYDTGNLQLYLGAQAYGSAGTGHWTLHAPEAPGLYQLRLEHKATGGSSLLNLFVGRSLPSGEEALQDYFIGPPPPDHSKYPAFYREPQLYFEVTEENVDTRLSEHFTLRQFLCKQESGYPKYITLRESLLVLLEGLVQAIQQAGYPVETLGVISGYRTPYYNKSIGNVPNSRHVYGDAMDFFVDADGDGAMDDLNNDGERNRADVDLLYRIVESYKQRAKNMLLIGGVGRYYQATHHGGFVHVDARGFRARW